MDTVQYKKPPIANRILASLFKRAWNLITHPKKIYGEHNYYISRILEFFPGNKNIINIRRKYVMLVNTFIILPFIVGIVGLGFSVVVKQKTYKSYYKKVVSPIKGKTVVKKIKKTGYRIYLAAKNHPFGKEEGIWILLSILLPFLGSKFIELKNPNFEKEQEIKNILEKFKYLDFAGRPWRPFYTPDAILFVAFGPDENKFAAHTSFWNAIKFAPSVIRKDEDDTNIIVVPRKYKLPNKIMFDKFDK